MGSWNRKRRSVEKNGWNPNEAWSLACSGISALFSKVWQMHHDKEDNLRGKWMRDTHYISYYLWHFSVNRGIIFKSLWNKIFFKKPTKVICLGKEETEGVSLTCAWCPRAHSPSYTCLVPAARTEHSKWMKLPALKWTDRLLIPSHHSTRKLFCCPKSTELTPSAFSPTHHNFSPPSQVGAVISVSGCERQIYQFLPIFNLFF